MGKIMIHFIKKVNSEETVSATIDPIYWIINHCCLK